VHCEIESLTFNRLHCYILPCHLNLYNELNSYEWIGYPFNHIRTSDSRKSSFPSLLLHFKLPSAICLLNVDGDRVVNLATWLIDRYLSENLPSSFFSILSSCSLIGKMSMFVISSPYCHIYWKSHQLLILYICYSCLFPSIVFSFSAIPNGQDIEFCKKEYWFFWIVPLWLGVFVCFAY